MTLLKRVRVSSLTPMPVAQARRLVSKTGRLGSSPGTGATRRLDGIGLEPLDEADTGTWL